MHQQYPRSCDSQKSHPRRNLARFVLILASRESLNLIKVRLEVRAFLSG